MGSPSSLLSLLAARVALADARYTDPAGDSGGAPDIAAVNVTNDAAGNLTFTVTHEPVGARGGRRMSIWFNTDMNSSTGDDGIEYALFAESGGWGFERWDGSQYVAAAAPSANSTYANGALTFKINKADLGNARERSSSTCQRPVECSRRAGRRGRRAGRHGGLHVPPDHASAYRRLRPRP